MCYVAGCWITTAGGGGMVPGHGDNDLMMMMGLWQFVSEGLEGQGGSVVGGR
jgi:hypothetical protein